MFQKELLFLKRFLLTINKVFWTQCLMNWKQQMELMYIKIFVMFSASTWIKMIKIIEIFLFHKSILLFRNHIINLISSQLSAIQNLCFLWFGRLNLKWRWTSIGMGSVCYLSKLFVDAIASLNVKYIWNQKCKTLWVLW